MKKILALLMAGLMTATAFAGCGAKKDDSPSKADNTAEATTQSASPDSASPDSADSADWDAIAAKGEMTIGITYFQPMNYKNDSGELTGFETEFAQAVCKELGVEPKFQEIDWDSKEMELKSKTIDCIWNGLTITDERKENMDITTPYMENKQVMVVKAENADKFTTAEALSGASVVAEAGSAGEEVAKGDEFFKDADFTAVQSQASALLEVKSGTADVAVIDYVMSIGTLTGDSDYSDLKMVESKSFAPEQYGIALRKDSGLTLVKVNAAIDAVAKSGKLAEIAEKYNLSDLLLIK